MAKAAPYGESMHFVRYEDLLKNPWGDVLFDVKGDVYSLKLSLGEG